MRGLGCYCLAVSLLKLLIGQSFLRIEAFFGFSIVWAVVFFAAGYLFCTLLWTKLCIPAERYLLPVSFAVYSFLTLREQKDVWFVFALGALWAVLFCFYSRRGWLCSKRPFSKRAAFITAAAFILLFCLIVGAQGVFRYRTFIAPNYDFGIFCNMFYRMRTEGLPLTTCERDGLLSHFSVHFSPALYLLLPIYAVIPHPVTLQVLQSLILGSAAIPVWLLARKFHLSYRRSVFCSAIVLLHPAVGNGTNYDFHENCMLLPLLLWMFYFFETNRVFCYALFAGLTLLVKEDAAVYVVFFGLYVLMDRKQYLLGILTCGGAAAYFFMALFFLSHFGEGVMSGRYGNFIPPGGGLLHAVRTVLLDPAFVLTQLLADADGASLPKLLFLCEMLFPLALTPLFCREPSRLILLFPMVLMNLMTLYEYQYQIGYQYSFGSVAFLMYLSLLNLPEFSAAGAKTALCTAMAICSMLFFATTVSKTVGLMRDYEMHKEKYAAMEAAVHEIPAEAAVSCSTCLLPHLSQRKVIFEDEYHIPQASERLDFVLIDLRFGHEAEIEKYISLGYGIDRTVAPDGENLMLIMTPESTES